MGFLLDILSLVYSLNQAGTVDPEGSELRCRLSKHRFRRVHRQKKSISEEEQK